LNLSAWPSTHLAASESVNVPDLLELKLDGYYEDADITRHEQRGCSGLVRLT